MCIKKRVKKKQFEFELNVPQNYNNLNRSELVPAWPSKEKNYAEEIKMAIPIEVLRNLKKSSKCWYIVADMNVLIDDIHFLKSYIIGDPTCQLLTPVFVLNKIEEMCASVQGYRFITAKKSIEQLEFCSRHVRFDDDVEERDSPTSDSDDIYDVILKCCLQLMSHDFHVVLVTKSHGLRTLAEIRGVHVYNLEEIKIGARKIKVESKQIITCTIKNEPL